jgi:hypothetical protein
MFPFSVCSVCSAVCCVRKHRACVAKSYVCGVLWCQNVVPGGIALGRGNFSEGSLDGEGDKGRLARLVE